MTNEKDEALRRLRSLNRVEAKLLLGTDLLHIAVERRDIEAIELLISLGADVNRKSSVGLTPMREAIHPFSFKNNPTDAIPLLLIKHGAVVLGDVLEYAIAFNFLKLIGILADTILTQPQMKDVGLSWNGGEGKYSANTPSTKRDTCILCYAINLSIEYGNRMALDRFLNAHIVGGESWWRECYGDYDRFSIRGVVSYGLYRMMRGVGMFQLYTSHKCAVHKPDYDGCADVFLKHGADPLSLLPIKRFRRMIRQRRDESEAPIHHLTRVSEHMVMKMLTSYDMSPLVLPDLIHAAFKQNMTVAFEWCIQRFHDAQRSIEILDRERAGYFFELIDVVSELTKWGKCPRGAMYMLDLLLISGVNMRYVYSLDTSRTAMPFLYAKSINIPNGFITHLLSFHRRITLRRIALFNIRNQ